MNLKNKLLSAGLAACMVVPMAMPVCAEDANPVAENTKTANLTYTVGSKYDWTIHSDINFGSNAGVNQTEVPGIVADGSDRKVTVTNNVIEEGKTLYITATGSGSDGEFSIKNGDSGTQVLKYVVKSGTNEVAVGGQVLAVNAGVKEGSTNMTFKLSTSTKTAEIAGTYSGIITYTARVQ